MSSAREAPFGRLGGRAFAKLVCTDSWRHGLLHRVIAAVIIAWVVQDIRAGRALSKEPADVRASVQTAYDDPSEDWAGWRATVPRTCAPSFTYEVPAGGALPAEDAVRYCLPLLSKDGYVPLSPELMRYSADTLTLDSWSVPDCGLQFGDQLLGVMVSLDGKTSAAYTFSMLGGGDVEQAGRIAWLKNEPGTRKNWFYGDWQGVNQSGALSMRIGPDAVELGNGQRLPILEETSTHIVVQARDGSPATGKIVDSQIHWDICEAECELERMPEYISRPTRSIPWDGIVAIGNATKDQSWWQDPAGDDPTLLFSIDASVRDQDLDNVLARKLQQHAVETGIPLKAMHVDVTKLWIKDRTLELVSYYDYEPPWQSPGADARELFFPLEVYGSWLSHTTEAHDWSGLGEALQKAAEVGGTVSFLVQSVGAEPCFIAPPGEDHVKKIDDSRVHVRAFTSHSARMVTREVSGTPLQHTDPRLQMKTWSYWSSAGYNGDVWIGDANYVDHSHSAIQVSFKVGNGDLREVASLQSCGPASSECGEASNVDIVTDSWMGMKASTVRLPVSELLNRSGTDLSRCVDRCSINVELAFENRLWTTWAMSPWQLLQKGRRGDVSLSIRVSGATHHSSVREVDIAWHSNASMIHTAEHGGAIIGVYVTGEFGSVDPGVFLAHVGALLGVLLFGVTAADVLLERACRQKGGWASAEDDAELGGARCGQLVLEEDGDGSDREWALSQLVLEKTGHSKYDRFTAPPLLPAI